MWRIQDNFHPSFTPRHVYPRDNRCGWTPGPRERFCRQQYCFILWRSQVEFRAQKLNIQSSWWFYSGFFRQIPRYYFQLGHILFLPRSFKLIIQQSAYHSTLNNLNYWKSVYTNKSTNHNSGSSSSSSGCNSCN